ncbi:MAG: alpha-glucan family phosphorylase [Synergistaceae bacterium]|jgi:starch phosphorylase|nr:alpha-glucan family phosphorylase [Synergistaceae bacterium]
MSILTYGENITTSMMSTFERNPIFRSVGYFSMEIGISPHLPTYSGGLGILAGDILKSVADLGVPAVGVTLLYRKGYFRQELTEDGSQVEKPVDWEPEKLLTRLDNRVSVILEGRQIQVRAWGYMYVGHSGYPLPIYFLDTDIDENTPGDRSLTWELYGGDTRYRLCQEMILGVAGLRLLRDLGYNNIKTFHLNEGHAGFISLELTRELGYEDFDKVREEVIFTTHTPVAAGHDYFPYDLISHVVEEHNASALRRMLGGSGVSMTELGLKFSRYVNAVSKKHAEVSRKMFGTDKVDYVTNGVHSATWTCPGFARLYDKYIPAWRNDPSRLIQALQLPDEDVWKAHQAAKMRLFARVLEETGVELDPDILTIGFARRAATYKRADLLFTDVKKLLDVGAGQIQLIFAGKAHPHDLPAKDIIKRIIAISKDIGSAIPMVFMENYNMELAQVLTAGVDVWLNTPIRPREASGTSGMKCVHNGVMNFSVLDGWWIEGWIEDVTGWSIGPVPTEVDLIEYDEKQDAMDLYNKLNEKVIPTYYNKDKSKWIRMMKHTIALNASYFNTHRVVKEYCEKAYGTIFRGH